MLKTSIHHKTNHTVLITRLCVKRLPGMPSTGGPLVFTTCAKKSQRNYHHKIKTHLDRAKEHFTAKGFGRLACACKSVTKVVS